MEQSVQPDVAPAIQPQPTVKNAVDSVRQAITPSEQEAGEQTRFSRFVQLISYPLSVAAGFWTVKRDVDQSVYQNLKRYKAFDDILKNPNPHRVDGDKTLGLERLNQENGWARDRGEIGVEEYLRRANLTKNEYRMRVAERMEQRGLGTGYSNFFRKWNSIDKPGRIDALIKGATVTGIVAVALSVVNSEKLLEFLASKKEERER